MQLPVSTLQMIILSFYYLHWRYAEQSWSAFTLTLLLLHFSHDKTQMLNRNPTCCMPSWVSSFCLLWYIDSCRAKRRGLSGGGENACSRAIKNWLKPPCSRFEQVGKRRRGPANTGLHGLRKGAIRLGGLPPKKSTLASRCVVSCIRECIMQSRTRKDGENKLVLRNDFYTCVTPQQTAARC